MDALLPLIQDVGFPIVVTMYLLHRIEAKLDTLNNSIQLLPERLDPNVTNAFSTKKTVER